MIKIYNINGDVLLRVSATKEAVRVEELSKSDYISLSFNTTQKIILPVGAYIEYTYYIDSVRKVTRRFLLLEQYEPTQIDEMSWKYSPEFQHPKMILGKIPFYIRSKNSQNEDIKQTNWSFVGAPNNIMGKMCDFLNKEIKLGNQGWRAEISNNLKNSLNVNFTDYDVLSSLSAISKALGNECEWHIDYDNEVIYLGFISIGVTPVVLETGKNVGISSVSESKENYYNAYTVYGGSRNITQVNDKGENISSGDIRLQLSTGNGEINVNSKRLKYVIDSYSTMDLRQDKQNEHLFSKVLNFADVFPSLDTYVYDVRGREKYVIDSTTGKKIPLTSNKDGSVTKYKTFTVWYMRLAYCTTNKVEEKEIINTTVDNGITHYWYDFEITDNLLINGKNLSCSFEPNFTNGAFSSPLAGRGANNEYVGFELIYHKKDALVHDTDDVKSSQFQIYAGDYEIIYQEENNLIIPTNVENGIIPKGDILPSFRCNIVILYNIAMADVYIADAQQKLLEKAKEEVKYLLSDLNNYTVKSYAYVFEEDNPKLQIGQYVTYNNGQGYNLNTRVLKLVTNIDYTFIQEITVGNQILKGTITQLKEDVQSVIISGNNGSSQSRYTATQLNNIVAQYGMKFFLSKVNDDVARGIITFMEGLKIGAGNKKIDKDGNATLGDVVVDRIHDSQSTEEDRVIIGAQGFDLYMGEDGKSHLFIDYLTARTKFFAASAEVRKVSYSGGTTIFSNAGSTIAKVAYVFNSSGSEVIAYKCYAVADDGTTKTANWWHVGMMALCQTFNVKAGETENLQNQYYWRMVVGVGQETLEDGKLYDFVILSNQKTFLGRDNVVPSYCSRILAKETTALKWGNVLVSVAQKDGMMSVAELFAEQEGGRTQDDGKNDIASRVFYGYEEVNGGEPDVPCVGDVIVNVGDQIRWNSHGNVIKLTTSTEDSTTDTAPSITMYHGVGALYDTGKKDNNNQPVRNPYQWKMVTCVISPEKVKLNADRFELFTGTPDNVIDPVMVGYEVVLDCDNVVYDQNKDIMTPANLGNIHVFKTTGSRREELAEVDFCNNLFIIAYRRVGGREYDYAQDTASFDVLIGDMGLSAKDVYKCKVCYYNIDLNTLTTNAWSDALAAADGDPTGIKGLEKMKLLASKDMICVYTGADGKPGSDGKPGADGEPGADGKDAIQMDFNPSALTLDAVTDKSGNSIVAYTNASDYALAEVFVRKGGVSILKECTRIDVSNNGCNADVVRQSDNATAFVRVKSVDYITNSEGIKISRTSASVTVSVLYENVWYAATIAINVNVAALWSKITMDNKSLKTEFNEVSNKVDSIGSEVNGINGKVDGLSGQVSDLKQYTSSIEQSARNIALKVGERSVGRYNLLTGSAFWKESDAWAGNDTYRPLISTSEKYLEYNSVCIEGGGTIRGIDFFRVRINESRVYTASVVAKFLGNVAVGKLAVYISERDSSGNAIDKTHWMPVDTSTAKMNVWNVYTQTFEVSAEAGYIDCCYIYNADVNGYFAQLMLSEGAEYLGYTLSNADCAYIGGNLLDNTLTLTSGGSLSVATAMTTLCDASEQYKNYATLHTNCHEYGASIDVLEWNLANKGVLKQGEDYIFSFMARGTGYVNAYLYRDGTPSIFTEKCDKFEGWNAQMNTDGHAPMVFAASEEWRLFWVRWRIMGDSLPTKVLLRCPNGSEVYVCRPKLEYGCTPTDYTSSFIGYTEDRSAAAALLDTGIDIENRKMTLTADKTVFKTNKGKEVAVFSEDGINAALVKVQQLETVGEGSKVIIQDGIMEVLGRFGMANIRFGVNNEGFAVMQYYDNNGNLLYDLGPSGIGELQTLQAVIKETLWINVVGLLSSPYTELLNVESSMGSYSATLNVATSANDVSLFGTTGTAGAYIRDRLYVTNAVKLYLYQAPKVNGKYVPDNEHGLTTAEMTAAADGAYFTSNTTLGDNNGLKNLAGGYFIPWEARTIDNTQFRISVLKPGETVDLPRLYFDGFMYQRAAIAVGSTPQKPTRNIKRVYGGGMFTQER